MSPLKEPAYFLGPPPENGRLSKRYWQPIVSDKYRSSLSAYLDLFADFQGRRYIGEASVGYSQAPYFGDVAERIYQFNPEAKIIYLLRDPVTRTISHYWYKVQTADEMRSLASAIFEDEYYRRVSYYAYQLRLYLRFFSPNQIKVVTTEELSARPLLTLHDLFSWLGVDHEYCPDNLNRRYNVTPTNIVQLKGPSILNRFRYSRPWGLIGPLVPKPIRSLMCHLVDRRIDRRSVNHLEVVQHLRAIQIAQSQELSDLLNRGFPEWTVLYGDYHQPPHTSEEDMNGGAESRIEEHSESSRQS